MPPRSPLLILDCDGVLIRSEAANLAYYNRLFREFGLPEVAREDETAFRRLHTLSTSQVIDAFFPPARRGAVRAFAAGLGFGPFVALVEPEPGWGEVLDAWRGQGGGVAVATNRGDSAGAVLEAVGLRARVDHLVTVRDVARPKPAPDLLLRALELAGADPGQSLYVGDSPLDREAAEGAGVPFLGFRFDGGADAAAAVGERLGRLAGPGSCATLLASTRRSATPLRGG